MPRGYLKEKVYRLDDIENFIRCEMKNKGIKQWTMAKALNISQARFSQKLANCNFSTKDLLTIFQVLQTEPEDIGKLFIL